MLLCVTLERAYTALNKDSMAKTNLKIETKTMFNLVNSFYATKK